LVSILGLQKGKAHGKIEIRKTLGEKRPLSPSWLHKSISSRAIIIVKTKQPQENPAPEGLMRYKGGSPPLMICTALRAAMICQACGLDKQKENFW